MLLVPMPVHAGRLPDPGSGCVDQADQPDEDVIWSVNVNPLHQDAQFTSFLPVSLNFFGTVEVKVPMGVEASVSLTCSIDAPWLISVSPNFLTYNGPDLKEFLTTVVVPPDSPSNLFTHGRITAMLYLPYYPTMTKEVEITVRVTPYSGAELSLDEHDLYVQRGSTLEVDGSLYSFSNHEDGFELVFDELPRGVTCEVLPEYVLPFRGSTQFELVLNVSDEAPLGSHDVMLRVCE